MRMNIELPAGFAGLVLSSPPAAGQSWLSTVLLCIGAVLVLFALVRIVGRRRRKPRGGAAVQPPAGDSGYAAAAAAILDGLGGKENIVSFEHCITRLRLLVKDYTAVDEKKIRAAGVAGVMRPSKTRVDVIVGTKVGFVADELAKLL